jgi:hypothetical protein
LSVKSFQRSPRRTKDKKVKVNHVDEALIVAVVASKDTAFTVEGKSPSIEDLKNLFIP